MVAPSADSSRPSSASGSARDSAATASQLPPMRHPLDPGWAQALAPCATQFQLIADRLGDLNARNVEVLPEPDNILRVFRQPFDRVRVLVLGQDPYPTPGHPMGMSFSLHRNVRPLARSLTNIFQELHDDLGITPSQHGDLTHWADQGVLMLNRVLTVTAGSPGSHRGLGWEEITQQAIEALVARGTPLVALLWGADARKTKPLILGGTNTAVIESPHPSPLSARRGFFGSRPFSHTNEFLVAHGLQPIDWELPQ